MGLYKRLLEERAEVEQCQSGSLPRLRGRDSKVLVRLLESVSERRPGYTASLWMMHRLIKKGPRNAGEGMRLGSLKRRYPAEYEELRAERDSEFYEQRERFGEV